MPPNRLSESCQKKIEFLEICDFGETHETIVNIGGRGGIRTHGSIAGSTNLDYKHFNGMFNRLDGHDVIP